MDIQEISDSNVDKEEREGEVDQLTNETQKLELESDGVTEGSGGSPEAADQHHEEEEGPQTPGGS